MSGWSGGYVTDIEYMPGYYRHQTPAHLAVATLLGNVVTDIPGNDRLSFLELGCGQGFTSLMLAACNPGWTVTAVDFNPGQIAAARRFAAAAGVENISFLEADLSTLAEDALAASVPEADVVSMHGLWTWVPRPVQTGIVRLLRARVRAGGLVHVSYNALPGWQAAMGFQRLLRSAGKHAAGRSDRQARAGLELAEALAGAEVKHMTAPFVTNMMERLKTAPGEYLAHEYMNESWAPVFHADLCSDLADAKLDWVASARVLENFPTLMLTDAQRTLAERIDDLMVRELIKDLCLERGLRQDIFVRGPRRVGNAERDAALGEVALALAVPEGKFGFEAMLPAGRAEFNRGFYEPIVRALAAGPRTVGALLALPGLTGATDNPAEVIGMLLGTDQAIVVARPDAPSDPVLAGFNAVAARRLVRVEQMHRGTALASARLGAGLPAPALDLFAIGRLTESGGHADPAGWARSLKLDPEGQARLTEALEEALELRGPVWRQTGVI